jgi:N-acetylglutamate synthase-like GNAT family acetyltransferase
MAIQIIKTRPSSIVAKNLLAELSAELFRITGDDGRSSFQNSDLDSTRSIFLLLMVDGSAMACGALRTLSEDVCEIKRMYSKVAGKGYGKKILLELEQSASRFGYREIWLSTRKINRNAVEFYLKNGYQQRDGYGKYHHTDKSVCLAKTVTKNKSEGK